MESINAERRKLLQRLADPASCSKKLILDIKRELKYSTTSTIHSSKISSNFTRTKSKKRNSNETNPLPLSVECGTFSLEILSQSQKTLSNIISAEKTSSLEGNSIFISKDAKVSLAEISIHALTTLQNLQNVLTLKPWTIEKAMSNISTKLLEVHQVWQAQHSFKREAEFDIHSHFPNA